MNWIKSIVFVAIASFLFVGSIGVSIFSKVCPEDGVNISYFVPGENECCKREANPSHGEESCGDHCTKKQEATEDDCCSTSSELIQVKLDFLNKVQVKAVSFEMAEVQPVWIVDAPIVSKDIRTASGLDPPPKLRKEILTDFQQWLI